MIDKVAPEIENYFKEKYKRCGVKVVPGHHPEMKTKADVDNWIANLEKIIKVFEAEET